MHLGTRGKDGRDAGECASRDRVDGGKVSLAGQSTVVRALSCEMDPVNRWKETCEKTLARVCRSNHGNEKLCGV